MTLLPRTITLLLAAAPWISPTPAQAFFIDGEGHYGLRGETRTNEAFSKSTGTFQAIEQSFRLEGEARFNDQSSLFLEFRLFDNPREAYLGDAVQASGDVDCTQYQPSSGGEVGPSSAPEKLPCEHQDTGEPRYQPYTPKITKVYVRYAFDYCIVEAGRRPRQWGLGIFMDAGDKPFDTDATVFDGITCDINIQKTQTLGFSVGYDKLAETGAYPFIDPGTQQNPTALNRRFGANDRGDDINQYFFTINYDDRRANAGAAFTKQVGVYFAQVSSAALGDGGSNTDLKFLDLYTGFFFSDLALRNEVLFRMGKSADPNWQALGGLATQDGAAATNKLNAIALAGSLEWTMSRSGAAIGPTEFNRGDASRHVLFLNYAYAPGDEDGYRSYADGSAANVEKYRAIDRDNDVTALAFHRNFKPALLLFNARPESDSFIVDGAFNPSRVENATVLSTGYRYESMEIGNFEAKLITASLNKGVPGEIKSYFEQRKNAGTDDGERPIGYFGNQLGYELDLSYSYKIGREAEIGLAAAAALPGDAWKVKESTEPVNSFLLQSQVVFNF